METEMDDMFVEHTQKIDLESAHILNNVSCLYLAYLNFCELIIMRLSQPHYG